MRTLKGARLLAFMIISFTAGADLFAGNGSYQSDPAVMKRLEELAQQIKSLQEVVSNQNEVIQSQSIEIQSLRSFQENRPGVYLPAAKKSEKDLPSWFEGMKQGGDLRLRYEAFDNHGGTDQDRNRFRVRLRYGIEKQLGDDFAVGFRLTTGSVSDPTSTNQTLDGNFTYKTVVFDRLYAKYTPSQIKDYGPIGKMEIGAGKVENPFLRGTPQSQMVWDQDVTPEGIYEMVDFKPITIADSKLSAFIIGGQFPVVETATPGSVDSEMYGVMAAMKLETKFKGMDKSFEWNGAVAYYDYSDYGIRGSFASFARGNTIDPASADTLLAKDFNILNIYNELKIPTPWVPVFPFFDFAKNLGDVVGSQKPGDLDSAWGAGIRVGEAKKKGDWEAAYAYYYIEPNAVVGAFNDSDFGGAGYAGHADRRGSSVKLGYKLTDHLSLNLAGYFVNTVTNTPDEETRRFQTDLSWKF